MKAKEVPEAFNSEVIKHYLEVGFDQICEKCNTVGDLQKLNEEVRRLNGEIGNQDTERD